MTKIPSVELRAKILHVRLLQRDGLPIEKITKALTADRLALLTELRDSGLLEELDAGEAPSDNAVGSEQRTFGSNRTKRAIKAHLDELIKSTH